MESQWQCMKNEVYHLLLALLLLGCSENRFTQRENTMNEKTNPDVSKHFNALAQQWSDHCQSVALSSNINDYLNTPSYHELVKLGSPAIPLIMERYRTDNLPWGFVLDEITGLHMIEDRNHFSPPEIKKRWLDWWDKQRKITSQEQPSFQ